MLNSSVIPKSALEVKQKYSVKTVTPVTIMFHNSEEQTCRAFLPRFS